MICLWNTLIKISYVCAALWYELITFLLCLPGNGDVFLQILLVQYKEV